EAPAGPAGYGGPDRRSGPAASARTRAAAAPGAGSRGGPTPGSPPPAARRPGPRAPATGPPRDRKSTRLNSSHVKISYAVFCLKSTASTESSALTLHDALPIWEAPAGPAGYGGPDRRSGPAASARTRAAAAPGAGSRGGPTPGSPPPAARRPGPRAPATGPP